MRNPQLLAYSLLVLVLAGCASAGGAGQQTRRQENLLTFEEIRQVQTGNAYDLIRALRPNWLQSRGAGTGVTLVYLDGTRAGGLDFLRQIATQTIQGAQYLSGPEATTRYGTGHAGGVINITTLR
jgi:outer membrane receptor for ferrienterochelin and colicin